MTDSNKPLIARNENQSEEHYGISILRDGTWLYAGTPITRHNLVKLFASVLKKDELGRYWLETPYEKGLITVEDAPFIAVEMKTEFSGKEQDVCFRTNLDEWVTVSPQHPLRVVYDGESGAAIPYVMIRNGLEARIARAVYYDLVKIAVDDAFEKGLLGIWSGKTFYPIGRSLA